MLRLLAEKYLTLSASNGGIGIGVETDFVISLKVLNLRGGLLSDFKIYKDLKSFLV